MLTKEQKRLLLSHRKAWNDARLGEKSPPNLVGEDLQGIDLQRADLSRADMEGVVFEGTTLTGANFIGARLVRAHLVGAKLRGSLLLVADLADTDMTTANLEAADLRGANLRGAKVRNGILSGAKLWMADLREADLSGATLRGVDFTEALLDGAQLDGCDLSHATVRSIQMEAASWRTVIIHGQKFVRESVRRGEQVLPFEAAQAKKVRRIGLRRTEDRSQVAVSAINTLLARERYDQPGELFDKRSTHLMRLCDDAAQSTHLLYEYLNCVAAGLVSRPEHMPGQIFDFAPWKKGHIEVERPDFYFSTNQPEVLQLEVTPPPLLYAAFHGDMDKLVYSMQRLAEQGGRELRAKQRKPVLGARAITRLHPWNEPRTLRETRGQRVPTFRIGTRGIVGQEQHIEAAVETRTFRQSYRAVLDSYRAGQPEPPFPFGTYQMRVEHGAAVTEPPELGTAIVTRPGLTLRDVQAQLEQRVDSGEQADNSHARMQLTEDTREALREQAQDICDHAAGGMDLGGGQRATAVPSDGIPALFLKEVPDDRRAALRKDVAFSRVEFRKAGKRVNGFLMVARDPDYDRSHAGVCEVQPNCSLKEDGVQIAPRGVIEEAFVADSHPSEKKSLLFTGVFEEDHRNQNGLRLWTAYDLDDPLPQWTTELYTSNEVPKSKRDRIEHNLEVDDGNGKRHVPAKITRGHSKKQTAVAYVGGELEEVPLPSK